MVGIDRVVSSSPPTEPPGRRGSRFKSVECGMWTYRHLLRTIIPMTVTTVMAMVGLTGENETRNVSRRTNMESVAETIVCKFGKVMYEYKTTTREESKNRRTRLGKDRLSLGLLLVGLTIPNRISVLLGNDDKHDEKGCRP